MISIEAYRAAIGRHNNRCKHTNKGYLPLFNGYEIYFNLIACFLLSFLPVTLYLMFLMFICITIDLTSYRLTKYLQINNRDTFLNNLDTQCNNFLKGDCVHPVNSKKKSSLIRYLCLMLLLL